MNAAAQAWLNYAWGMLWQSSVVIAVVLAAYVLLRKASASFRYALLCLVLVKFLLPPDLSLMTGAGDWGGRVMERVRERPAPVQVPVRGIEADKPALSAERDRVIAAGIEIGTEHATEERGQLPVVLAIAWGGGILGLLLGLGVHATRVYRAFNRARKIEDPELLRLLDACRAELGGTRRVPLYCQKGLSGPLLIGFIRPRIVIPEHLLAMDARLLRPVLLHELAHVKRHDLAVNALQIVLQTLWFFHPGLWLTNWLIRRERERACDDMVLRVLKGERNVYAESLISVVKQGDPLGAPGYGTLGILEGSSAMKTRFVRILDEKRKITGKVSLAGTLVILMLAAVILPLARTQSNFSTTANKRRASEMQKPGESVFDPYSKVSGKFTSIEYIYPEGSSDPDSAKAVHKSGTFVWYRSADKSKKRFDLTIQEIKTLDGAKEVETNSDSALTTHEYTLEDREQSTTLRDERGHVYRLNNRREGNQSDFETTPMGGLVTSVLRIGILTRDRLPIDGIVSETKQDGGTVLIVKTKGNPEVEGEIVEDASGKVTLMHDLLKTSDGKIRAPGVLYEYAEHNGLMFPQKIFTGHFSASEPVKMIKDSNSLTFDLDSMQTAVPEDRVFTMAALESEFWEKNVADARKVLPPRPASAKEASSPDYVSKYVTVTSDHLKNIAVALEQYHIDNNSYPAFSVDPLQTVDKSWVAEHPNVKIVGPTFMLGQDPSSLQKGAMPIFTLTTPISYLTCIPADPFAPGNPALRFYAVNPMDDPNQGSGWIAWGAGPDGKYDLDWTRYKPGAKIPSAEDIKAIKAVFADVTYDPSNGAASAGDVFRFSEGKYVPASELKPQ